MWLKTKQLGLRRFWSSTFQGSIWVHVFFGGQVCPKHRSCRPIVAQELARLKLLISLGTDRRRCHRRFEPMDSGWERRFSPMGVLLSWGISEMEEAVFQLSFPKSNKKHRDSTKATHPCHPCATCCNSVGPLGCDLAICSLRCLLRSLAQAQISASMSPFRPRSISLRA